MYIIYILKCLKSTSLNINVTVTNTMTEQTTANLPTITTALVEETTTTTAGTEFQE